MPATLTLPDGNIFHGSRGYSEYVVFVALSGTYPTGGEPINFRLLPLIKASRPPIVAICGSYGGYLFEWVVGTTIANGLLKIYTAAGAELANAGYPGAFAGLTIVLKALFRKNV